MMALDQNDKGGGTTLIVCIKFNDSILKTIIEEP